MNTDSSTPQDKSEAVRQEASDVILVKMCITMVESAIKQQMPAKLLHTFDPPAALRFTIIMGEMLQSLLDLAIPRAPKDKQAALMIIRAEMKRSQGRAITELAKQ